MSDEKHKNGNGRISLGVILTVLGMVVGPLAVWGDGQRKAGELDEKVTTLQKRSEEDRKDQRQQVNEVKEYAKAIDSNVQIILQKLTAMEAVQRQQQQRRDR